MNIYTQDKCLLSNIRVLYPFLISVFIMFLSTAHAKDVEKKAAHITVKMLSELVSNEEQSVPASVLSLNKPMLSAQISAKVEKINVDIGDNVKKGDVLVVLNCLDYQYAQQQAKANYLARKAQAAFTEKTYKRNKRLVQQATLPRNSLDQSESEYLSIKSDIEGLKVQVSTTELNVRRCKITAPFSGQITQRQVQKGQLVSANTLLLELLQTKNLQVSAELSSKQSQQLKQAEKIYFKADGKKSTVKLHKVVSLIKENTRTQTVRFHLPEKSTWIAGTAGRIAWKNKQVQLPANYLSKRNGKLGVLIMNKNTVEFITLKGAEEGQATNINLPLNTQIIDSGRLTVRDKQVVKVQ